MFMTEKEETGIYHCSFCSCSHCPFMPWGTNPSVHFPGGCAIQQDELRWSGCHLALPPTHPKGQLCCPAGSPGLLPLDVLASTALLPLTDPQKPLLWCPLSSGMKDFPLHLEPAHLRSMLLIFVTAYHHPNMSSGIPLFQWHLRFLLKWLCSLEIPRWVAWMPQLTSAKTRQMHEECSWSHA